MNFLPPGVPIPGPRPARKDPRGFTLIELTIVVMIIAILAAMGIYLYRAMVNKARMTQAKTVHLFSKERSVPREKEGKIELEKMVSDLKMDSQQAERERLEPGKSGEASRDHTKNAYKPDGEVPPSPPQKPNQRRSHSKLKFSFHP